MRPALLVFGALFATGCAVGPTNDAPDADAVSSTATALVAVERATGPGDATRASVVARFVRSRSGAVDDATLRVIGLAQDLPAIGACTADVASDDATPSANQAGVAPLGARGLELLDVGPLAVEGPQSRAVLLPRAMPDPAGVLSGVFYSARTAEAFAPGARLALRASGGVDLDAFAVSVAAPLELADVRVAPSAQGLDVAWDLAPSDVPDARDQLYVDVLAPAPRVVARCAASLGEGSARLVVPASLVGALEEGQVAVHRVHREAFRAKGVEPGVVRFDVARVVAFRR